MSATQLTALITPIVSAIVVAVLNYFNHNKTRKVINANSSVGTMANGGIVGNRPGPANPPTG